jgi:para-nitrobenzyl esterase
MRRDRTTARRPRSARAAAGFVLALAVAVSSFIALSVSARQAGAGDDHTAKAAAAEGPVVKTTYGKVRGHESDGILAFKGIPYGGSTAGDNRFKPPTRPASWEGVRDAIEYGNRAPQAPLTKETAGDYGRLIHF